MRKCCKRIWLRKLYRGEGLSKVLKEESEGLKNESKMSVDEEFVGNCEKLSEYKKQFWKQIKKKRAMREQ